MSDPISPPAARSPAAAAELVALAVSDGDLGAAVAQYEPGACLRPWARPGAAQDAGLPVDGALARIIALRLPLDMWLVTVIPAPGLALLVCERRIDGTGPSGATVSLRGLGCTVVRPQGDGSWRIAADFWQLAPA